MTKLFFGGTPTLPDIKRIREAFPEDELTPADVISHEQLEKILGVKRTSYRYRTVTHRWRKMVFDEKKIVIGPLQPGGIGYKVYTDAEKTALSGDKVRTAVGFAKRARDIADAVDPSNLDAYELHCHRHYQNISGKLLTVIQQYKPSKLLPTIYPRMDPNDTRSEK